MPESRRRPANDLGTTPPDARYAGTMPVPDQSLTTLDPLDYHAFLDRTRTGDILLCSGTHWFSRLIRWATASEWSHIAMVVRVDDLDQVMVMEAVEQVGVRMVPFHHFLTENATKKRVFPGEVILARHDEFEAKVAEGRLRDFSRFAVDRLGDPFGAREMTKIVLRLAVGRFRRRHMPRMLESDDEFICSEYVYRCYQQLGIEVEWNGLGFISPACFARDPRINPVARLSNTPFSEGRPPGQASGEE